MTKTDYFIAGVTPAIAIILAGIGIMHLLGVLTEEAFAMIWKCFFFLVGGTVFLAAVWFIGASEAPTLPKRKIVVFETDKKKNP
jgi:hypothetical protein